MGTFTTSPPGTVRDEQIKISEASARVREWLATCRDTPQLSLSTESVSKEDDLSTDDALQEHHLDHSYSEESRKGPGGLATPKGNAHKKDYSVFCVSDINPHQANDQTDKTKNFQIDQPSRRETTSDPTGNPTGNQASEPIESVGSVGPAAALLAFLRRVYDDSKNSFTVDDFLYALIFGLLPTVWDVFTDISLGSLLEARGYLQSAGICWLFVCFPFVFLCMEKVTQRTNSICLLFGLVLGFSAICFYLIARWPGLFFYPALCLSLLLLGVKILAVFVHTPHMKQFSMHLSHMESSFEASCQLLLIMQIWLAGGELYLISMISSIVVIGKVSAEAYLMAEPNNLLDGKTFVKRIALTLRYMPVFALTAFFRCGAGVVNVLNYNSFRPFSPVFTIFLLYCYIFVYYCIFTVLLLLLRLIMSDLKQLTTVEIAYALVRLLPHHHHDQAILKLTLPS